MEPSAPTRRLFSHPIIIALTALLLLAGVTALVVWLVSEPTMYSLPVKDPQWVMYPESHINNGGESPAFDGNVKLLSLQQPFQLSRDYYLRTDPEAEQFLKRYCHVLIDLPPKAGVRYFGTGWSTSRGIAYTEVEVYMPEEGDVPGPSSFKTKFRISYLDFGLTRTEPYPDPDRLPDRTLAIQTVPYVYSTLDGKRIQIDPKDDVNFQVTTEPGEVVVVHLEDDGSINSEPIRIGERATDQLEAADVERLLRNSK